MGSSSLTRDWTQASCIGEHGVLATGPPGKSPFSWFWWAMTLTETTLFYLHFSLSSPRAFVLFPLPGFPFLLTFILEAQLKCGLLCQISRLLLLFSHSVVSDSLLLHGLQHTRLPSPSPSPGVKLVSIESVMPSSHLILCYPLLLLPSIFPSIRDFSS